MLTKDIDNQCFQANQSRKIKNLIKNSKDLEKNKSSNHILSNPASEIQSGHILNSLQINMLGYSQSSNRCWDCSNQQKRFNQPYDQKDYTNNSFTFVIAICTII